MRLGKREFKAPSLSVTVIYVLVAVLMLSLGVWQLQRAQEKIQLASEAANALVLPPLNLNENSLIEAERRSAGYIRVKFRGKALAEQQFLWDNRIIKGQVGYEVITPVELETANGGKKVLLVNRGWVPLGTSRDVLPVVTFEQETIEFAGILTTPSRGFASGDAVAATGSNWPKVIQYFNYPALAQSLGLDPSVELVAALVQSLEPVSRQGSVNSPQSDNSVVGTAEEQQNWLFRDNWQAVANGPEKHYGYAFQWFAMFIALSVIFIAVNTRMRGSA